MSKIEQIRCVHPNGKACWLNKEATENVAFMKKYGLRVEHVAKEIPKTVVSESQEGRAAETVAIEEATIIETNPEAEAEAIDKQVAEALAEAKPKQTRKPRTPKKPTKK